MEETTQQPNDEKTKKLELEKAEIEKIHREHIQEKLKECDFKEIDGRRYSFVFSKMLFIFHIPTLMEKTQIKSIHSQIAFIPGAGIFSSSNEIEGSGDIDLICSSKLITHTTVLLEKIPKDFDVEELDEGDQFKLGYHILITEREFMERKKKASSSGQ